MGEDGARGKDWLRARGHHLFHTDTLFWFHLHLKDLNKCKEICLQTANIVAITGFQKHDASFLVINTLESLQYIDSFSSIRLTKFVLSVTKFSGLKAIIEVLNHVTHKN